jgi:hypothetical protein
MAARRSTHGGSLAWLFGVAILDALDQVLHLKTWCSVESTMPVGLLAALGLFGWVALIGFGVVAAYHLVFVITALLERHPVNPLTPVPLGERVELHPYLQAMNEMAAEAGFVDQGTFGHAKGGMYRVYTSMWFSPERDVLAVIGGGKMAKLPFRKTGLYSRATGEGFLVSTDEAGLPDLSGLTKGWVLLHADFDELLSHHMTCAAEAGVALLPFDEPTGLAVFDDIETRRVQRLEQFGYARFLDPARTTWRYTFKGVFALLRRKRVPREQAHRVKIPRPGS